MKPRKTISAYVLLVGVMGLSIVGGVLAFQIFSAATKSQLTQAQKDAIKPIDGTIKEEVINNLVKRVPIFENEISEAGNIVTTPTPVASPSPTVAEAATESAVASPSGEITEE